MNIVEWGIHKFLFAVIFAVMIAGGTIVYLWGPKDNQLVYYFWVGITGVIVYYVLYVMTKAAFWGGSRVNL